MNPSNKNFMPIFIHFSFLFLTLFVVYLVAQPINNQKYTDINSSNTSVQLQLTENEKIWIAEHPIIKVGVDTDYAHYESLYADGKDINIVTQYLNRLEKTLGLHFEIINDKPWMQLLQMAKEGELDMLTSIVKTPNRSEYLTFSDSYSDTPIIIIDNGKGTFIGSLKQLSGKRVSIEKGYFMEEFITKEYPTIILLTTHTTKEALQMVVDNLADAYVGDANVADSAIKTNDFDTLRFSGQTEYISHQSFALTQGNEPLALILNKAMMTIPKDETDAMFNRWLNIDKGIKKETLIKYGLAIALIFLVISYWVYWLLREINHRKIAEEKLRKSEALYRNLTEDMVDVLWKTDKNFHFTYISPSIERIIGYKAEELIGHHIFEIFTDEGIATSIERMRKREEDEKKGIYEAYSTLEIQHKCKNGGMIWGEVVSKPELDKNQKIIGYHGISRNVTERKEMQDKIRELAFYDPLTKLPNRRLLHDRLNLTIASSKRSKKYSAVIYLDLDNFKPLNDTYGHSIGDLLLIEVAHRLKKCVREIDTVARVGGDEFVIVINDLNEHKEKSTREVNMVAEKILSALSQTYTFEIGVDKTIEHHCSASIGVLVFKADDESEENLFKHADAAMYEAKDAGRNTIRFFDSNNATQ